MEPVANETEVIQGRNLSTSEPDVEIESELETVSPPAVAGVEENVNSRFIDYSIATPWEDLIASIERGIQFTSQVIFKVIPSYIIHVVVLHCSVALMEAIRLSFPYESR